MNVNIDNVKVQLTKREFKKMVQYVNQHVSKKDSPLPDTIKEEFSRMVQAFNGISSPDGTRIMVLEAPDMMLIHQWLVSIINGMNSNGNSEDYLVLQSLRTKIEHSGARQGLQFQ